MVFLFRQRPSSDQQKACIEKSGGKFNYDSKYRGASAKSVSSLRNDIELSNEGFFLNHSRTLVGSGLNTYERGKNALLTWRHFALNWAMVDPSTPIEIGSKFCVCAKEILPWIAMPLQVAYVTDIKNPNKEKLKASFGFGSGTLQGHLLSGEERFSIEMDENNQVWYEILSFSKPAHFLSFITYPYVQLRQKVFAHQSANAVVNYVNQQPKM
ncbi:hypothetical protein C5167_037996 [Papaver somniferum]|uniref:DUF1990 domain-containing protein n=1 Tax=Papaver somniferum TaxID=3469 RepID=A0A4Y7ICA0_PAPSO|nr:UPF0548 protein At2g17695-like [Papaver somniferum]RZC45045.1 hypothetical protein C5167_037996 [Papaver somniferum]